VRQEFGPRSKEREEKFRNKKLSKFIISIISKNNKIIKIVAIEILNTDSLLISNDKISP
jgi:hypothetical protein